MKISWVKQEDAHGCGLAVLAMLTGKTYESVKSDFVKLTKRPPESFGERGINHIQLDAYLARCGFAISRSGQYDSFTNKKRRVWPPRAIHDFNYCEVEQAATGNWHFVVLLRDGSILDPLMPDIRYYSDYKRIASIAGVFHI